MTLRCLFVDFDSFFASVEQHDDPRLRGRPVAVVAVPSDTTCCLAASQEAKGLGIKTGPGVREARERCPDIALVLARPWRYIEMHHAFMAAIGDCIPTEKAASIDEVPCTLIGRERQRDNAIAIARRIKQRLCDVGIGPDMSCSIGIGPNRFLAKTASDMNKPDGLTVIEQADLPHALHGLALRLEIADDGCGVPEELAEHLFLPLVSGRAEGTGLGLALAQQVAREHQGTLTYRSRPGHTVFTLLLPIGGATQGEDATHE